MDGDRHPGHWTLPTHGDALPSGKVLVAGGAMAPLEQRGLYDPATGTWTTGSLGTARYTHGDAAAQRQVLVAGKQWPRLQRRGLYDPASGTWTATGSLVTARPFRGDAAAQGKVLVAGGNNGPGGQRKADPASGRWRATGGLAPHALTRRRCCPMARCWWRGIQWFLEQRGVV